MTTAPTIWDDLAAMSLDDAPRPTCGANGCGGRLWRDLTATGVKVRAWCFKCQRSPTPRQPFVAVRSLSPEVVDNLPQWPGEGGNDGPCAVCGTVGPREVHHWAPRHLFGADADKWPTANLCGACHRQWHDLVTPKMSKR